MLLCVEPLTYCAKSSDAFYAMDDLHRIELPFDCIKEHAAPYI